MSRDSLPPLEDEFTRALLGSADADGPTPAAYAKVAATLGVGVSIGASLPAAAAVAAAGTAGVARWSSSLSAKLFFGFSGALLVGGAGALLARGPGPVEPAPSAVHVPAVARTSGESLPVASARPSRAEARPVAPAGASVAANPAAVRSVGQGHSPAVLALRPLAAAPAARRTLHAAPVRAPARAPASVDSSLAEQVHSLDRARVALAGGDPSSSLAEIARYRAAWPSGVFLTEASVLEIESLAASGQRSRARARAADFVAAHPDSPQADRLRALLPRKKP